MGHHHNNVSQMRDKKKTHVGQMADECKPDGIWNRPDPL
jgi:hypothetical protein